MADVNVTAGSIEEVLKKAGGEYLYQRGNYLIFMKENESKREKEPCLQFTVSDERAYPPTAEEINDSVECIKEALEKDLRRGFAF